MAESPDETRREIEATRQRIAEAAGELEERFQEATNWRKIVANYPLESTAVALVSGFILSSLILPGVFAAVRSSRERVTHREFRILDWIRPIVVPVVAARIIDYMRERPK
ncbi:MAG: hypothetical protein K6T91_06195 [Firmicutes bacterium]|nr:hypothetical protein [Bacillota bacterium]